MVIGPTPPGTGVMARGDLLRLVERDVADELRLAFAERRRGSCRRR